MLAADHILGLTFISKVDLADLCMRIWVWLKNIPYVASLVPKETYIKPQLVSFHLSIPMGC